MSHVAQVSDVAHGPLVYDNVSALKISDRKANHLVFSLYAFLSFGFKWSPNFPSLGKVFQDANNLSYHSLS